MKKTMDGTAIARLANAAAARMKRQGIPPVEAVSAVFRESYGGGGFDEELKHAVLRELGRRGGAKTARTRLAKTPNGHKRLQRMIHEAKILAFQRRDHLLPDP